MFKKRQASQTLVSIWHHWVGLCVDCKPHGANQAICKSARRCQTLTHVHRIYFKTIPPEKIAWQQHRENHKRGVLMKIKLQCEQYLFIFTLKEVYYLSYLSMSRGNIKPDKTNCFITDIIHILFSHLHNLERKGYHFHNDWLPI